LIGGLRHEDRLGNADQLAPVDREVRSLPQTDVGERCAARVQLEVEELGGGIDEVPLPTVRRRAAPLAIAFIERSVLERRDPVERVVRSAGLDLTDALHRAHPEGDAHLGEVVRA
jgi:hypothetical protein